MLQRITSSSQLHSLKFKNKPDDPDEKYIRAKYMYEVIKNVKAKLDSLTAEEVAAIYEQAIKDYTYKEGFVVLTGENKPTKPKLSLVS
jgi:hypothetical protein